MKKLLTIISVLFLSGCATQTVLPDGNPLARFAPLNVQVSTVDVRNNYNPITTTSDNAYRYAKPPAKWFENYARQRFVADGRSMGIVRFTITTASAIERTLPKDTGIAGAFQLDNPKQQDIALTVQMEVLGQPNLTTGRAQFTAQNSITFPSSASLTERENSLQNAVVQMISDMDPQIVKALRDQYKILGKSVVDTTQIVQPIN